MEMNQNEKTTLLFVHLISSFKTSGMQQLGKIPNHITGKMERDLPQASMTINMLDMINKRCHGNMTDEEDKFLQQTLSELKLNYVDEIGRKDLTDESPDEENSSTGNSDSAKDEDSDNQDDNSDKSE
jgi:hypothetical protein